MPKSLPLIDLSSVICCPPVAAGPLDDADALAVALRLKALADPARVKILSHVFAAGSDGVRNVELMEQLDLSDATVSHHLGQLHRAGLLTRERQGRNVMYRVDREALNALVRVIEPDCC